MLGKWDLFKVDLATKVNAITDGINAFLKFVHAPTIPEWKPAGYDSRQSSTMQIAPGLAYAKGTDFHPGGRALVGEEGWELAHTPGIGTYIVGMGGPQVWDLPRGTLFFRTLSRKKQPPQGFPVMQMGLETSSKMRLRGRKSW
ncbi:hypothetical protein ACO1DC_16090 [Bacillus velezensis]